MRILLTLMALFTISFSLTVEQAYRELLQLTPKQKQILYQTFYKAKPFDYQYTLTAIAWQESKFGKYVVNVSDGEYGSYGVFHNLLSSVCMRHGCSMWKRSRIAERLIFDYDFSFAEALSELKYWENYWKDRGVDRVWTHTVCSYNAGHNWKNGYKYRNMIIIRIKALKRFIKDIP